VSGTKAGIAAFGAAASAGETGRVCCWSFSKEHGFWISRDEVSGQFFTRPFATSGVENEINPGSPPPDAIAFFHTHPYGGIQIGAAPPSLEDEAFAARVGLPGLIQSHVGMYYFGPPLRPVR
jgi:hypothetical protein